METKQPNVKKEKPIITPKMMEKYLYRTKPTGIKREYYPYIQCGSTKICQMMSTAIERKLRGRKNRIRILDVGSGTGGAILLMKGLTERIKEVNKTRKLYFDFTGIEIDPVLVEIANKQNITTISGDALRFKKYDQYDIIYYYHPIADEEIMRKLEQKIENDAAPGTIIVSTLKTMKDVGGYNWKVSIPKGWETFTNEFTTYYNRCVIIRKPKKYETTKKTK